MSGNSLAEQRPVVPAMSELGSCFLRRADGSATHCVRQLQSRKPQNKPRPAMAQAAFLFDYQTYNDTDSCTAATVEDKSAAGWKVLNSGVRH